ncbi:MAG: ABC transporter ATP-binding protein [Patescibacteria group bacterium]
MSDHKSPQPPKKPPGASIGQIFAFLKPYATLIIGLIILVSVNNGLSLFIPSYIGQTIDGINQNNIDINQKLLFLCLIVVTILIFALLQILASNYTSELVAKNMRLKLIDRVSKQSFNFVSEKGVNELLTNFTSDVDAVKYIVSQGVVSAISAIVLLVGSVILLLRLNLQLGLIAISILPIIVVVFVLIFGRIGKFFRQAQENLGQINRVINESVVGAMLIRVLNSQQTEMDKFEQVSLRQRDIGYAIIDHFSALLPIVNLVSNAAIVIIVWFGGYQIVEGKLSIGDFSAFLSYYNLLITPIFILGFISNLISRGSISLDRINKILDSPLPASGVDSNAPEQLSNTSSNSNLISSEQPIRGEIEFRNVSLKYGKREVLKNISFKVVAGTRNAILGPTAAGKTQIFNLLTGLVNPTAGEILIDGQPIQQYDKNYLFKYLGLVFQDSIIFNTTLQENIAFSEHISLERMNLAIDTASLHDLIESLPDGLETKVSERGSNLSGGQKQRLMLARALAVQPKILLLDDFTARVDINTEKQILSNLRTNYPDLTLLSITQKIEPITDYDQIILLMEGELLGVGTHSQLLQQSMEYQQIWDSQQSIEADN